MFARLSLLAAALASWIYVSGTIVAAYAHSVDEATPGKLFAHAIDHSKGGALSNLPDVNGNTTNGTYSGGNGPVSTIVGGGNDGNGAGKGCLFVANYNSGSASVLKLASNGSIVSDGPLQTFQFDASGPNPARQNQSYAHEVAQSPDGAFVYVPDLGGDRIHRLKVGDNCAVTLESNSTVVAPGSGPRHIAFYPPSTGLFVYLASELASTLTAFKRSPSDGTLTQLGSPVSSMPEGIPLVVSPGTNRSVAEVAVSPDGRFVYVSDRGDPQEDHISIFKRSEDGTVSFEKWVGSGGRNVRHFSISPDATASYLAVGNQDKSNVVIFARNASTGDLSPVAERKDVGQVAFAAFMPAQGGHP